MVACIFTLATTSIYHWLYTGQLTFNLEKLPNRNTHQQQTHGNYSIFKTGASIENRPVKLRIALSWAIRRADNVLLIRGAAKDCLVTFVKHQSNLLWALKTPN